MGGELSVQKWCKIDAKAAFVKKYVRTFGEIPLFKEEREKSPFSI